MVSGNNLKNSQTQGFCMDLLNHVEGGGGVMNFYQVSVYRNEI